MEWFWPEGFYTLCMVGVFAVASFALHQPISVALVIAAVTGAVISGNGVPIHHLVEGSFGYLDTILIIACAMIFMKTVQYTGLMESMAAWVIGKFKSHPFLLTLSLMGFVMFPGMITGSSSAAVLTAGALVAPILLRLGVPAVKTAAAIAMAAIYGMAAPPVNIPAMIIGGGIDMPYVGFGIPLLVCTVPLAVVTGMLLIYPALKAGAGKSDPELDSELERMSGTPLTPRLMMPFFILLVLLGGERMFPPQFPSLGMPLAFLLAAGGGLLSDTRWNPLDAATEAIREALPVMGILVGVGMFIQIMTMTGVRGFFVVSALGLPAWLLYVGMATSMPIFGAVSAYGSATVLGVPFLLAMLGSNEIVVGAGLSLIAGLGDLMPPTALAGLFAAQVVGVKNYFKVLKACAIPALLTAGWGITVIICAKYV
ncbi:MAG: TRAP transporter large permease subunit [Desulfobacterales bacterium]|nr:TRAP transporter large permease subunit [Desulfobacterales bacterium]